MQVPLNTFICIKASHRNNSFLVGGEGGDELSCDFSNDAGFLPTLNTLIL